MRHKAKREKGKNNIIGFCAIILIIFLLIILNLRIAQIQDFNNQNYSIKKLNMNNIVEEKGVENRYAFIQESAKAIVGISKFKGNNGMDFNFENETSIFGSGVMITENGYILTNYHIVGNKYSTCYVTLENGEMYNGNVVWVDENIDLAIVKIAIAKSSYLKLGDSDKINLGEDVYAIGNPIGFEFKQTVTKGIVSGLNRTIKIGENNGFVYMEDLIQTDCTINNGNSGGALINLSGELLGINTIKINEAQGIGFAVPVNIVKPIINKLIENGKFEEAYLGIYGYDKEVIPYLSSNIDLDTGIYIDNIALDGPVYNSGVMTGDIITKIDGNEINKMSDLKKYIYSKNPGDVVKLSVYRKTKSFDIDIKLGYKL